MTLSRMEWRHVSRIGCIVAAVGLVVWFTIQRDSSPVRHSYAEDAATFQAAKAETQTSHLSSNSATAGNLTDKETRRIQDRIRHFESHLRQMEMSNSTVIEAPRQRIVLIKQPSALQFDQIANDVTATIHPFDASPVASNTVREKVAELLKQYTAFAARIRCVSTYTRPKTDRIGLIFGFIESEDALTQAEGGDVSVKFAKRSRTEGVADFLHDSKIRQRYGHLYGLDETNMEGMTQPKPVK